MRGLALQELPADRVVKSPPAWPTANSGRSSPVVDRPDDVRNHQQLQQLADAMQQQIGALATAVEQLKEVTLWQPCLLAAVSLYPVDQAEIEGHSQPVTVKMSLRLT